MRPEEMLERMARAIQSRCYDNALSQIKNFQLDIQAALRELVEGHTDDRPASSPTIEHTILAITELEL